MWGGWVSWGRDGMELGLFGVLLFLPEFDGKNNSKLCSTNQMVNTILKSIFNSTHKE